MPVLVTTPSRLHFGLLRFEQQEGLSYGGLGMMIAEPRWVVAIDEAERWAGEGVGFQRGLEFARRALDSLQAANKPPALRVRVKEDVPAHRGLGGGTQLGLAIAAGVRLLNSPDATAEELAALVGRGQRSAIGAHGFIKGGLIWETGRLPDQQLGQLAARVAVPEHWRIVLIGAGEQRGLSGKSESDAFSKLPPVPPAVSEQLTQIAEEVILPAAERGSLDEFGPAIYEYGRLAGECFATIQGGPYASPEIARCVRTIRELGIAGAGQSSWGPTVFAITESIQQAEWLRQSLAANGSTATYPVQITSPNNHGAVILEIPLSPRSLTGGQT
jgi:beta-RFAP synthase